MKKKPKITYNKKILDVLQELHCLYPTYSIGTHLSTVLDELGDLWGASDKDLYTALSKYKTQMEIYIPRETLEDELEIEKIIEDSKNLSASSLLQTEDNG